MGAEEAMHRIIVAATATLAILGVGPLLSVAHAMTFSAPSRILTGLKDINLVQDIACRRAWRCGPYGCNWRTVCWADPYSYPGTYYYGYDGPFDYGYQGFYNYYGGTPLRWSRPNRPYYN